jgi:hypothetical protein
MSLPIGFRFSQSSLQDFVDCKRRFQLRYIEKLAWPAIESEPVLQQELFMQRGRLFHQLAHQYLIGIPAERLAETIADDQLMTWWERFVEFATHIDDQSDIQIQNAQRFPEIALIAPLLEYQLQAYYDLILKTKGDTFIILDWKTNRVHPKQTQLAKRLQTRVYPFLLVKAGEHLNQEKEITPEAITMVYWFTEYPDRPTIFKYNQSTFEADQHYLQSTIAAIQALSPDAFTKTGDEHHCRFCKYRSLCDRGSEAGDFYEQDLELSTAADQDLVIDFEQVAEIEF